MIRQEQSIIRQVSCVANGADGIILHSQGYDGGQGINNQLEMIRSGSNGYRGITCLGQIGTIFGACTSLENQKASSLPTGVREDAFIDKGPATFIGLDMERSGGASLGKDLLRINAVGVSVIGSYFRGGRYQVYLNAARNCQISQNQSDGNASDPTTAFCFVDGGSGNNAVFTSYIGNNHLGSNVPNEVGLDPAAIYFQGFNRGDIRYAGVVGSQFKATVSGTFAPSPRANGKDQYLTISGPVTLANPTLSVENGRELNLILIQDSTGGRTVSVGSAYSLTSPIGSGDANKIYQLRLKCVITGSRTSWVQDAPSSWL